MRAGIVSDAPLEACAALSRRQQSQLLQAVQAAESLWWTRPNGCRAPHHVPFVAFASQIRQAALTVALAGLPSGAEWTCRLRSAEFARSVQRSAVVHTASSSRTLLKSHRHHHNKTRAYLLLLGPAVGFPEPLKFRKLTTRFLGLHSKHSHYVWRALQTHTVIDRRSHRRTLSHSLTAWTASMRLWLALEMHNVWVNLVAAHLRWCVSLSSAIRADSSSQRTRTHRSSSVQLDVAENDFAASMLLGTCFGLTASSLMPLAARATHLRGQRRPSPAGARMWIQSCETAHSGKHAALHVGSFINLASTPPFFGWTRHVGSSITQ
jgi:hypothetical protein